MIANRLLRGDRRAVVANIATAARARNWYAKVETNDPALTIAEQQQVLAAYLRRRQTLGFHLNTGIARALMGTAARLETAGVTISGAEQLAGITGGAIVTSNHFSPVENMIVRKAVRGHRLMIVSQLTNLQMGGMLGYLMNYADTLPVSTTTQYMGRDFPALLEANLARNRFILIYPEAEMWFNYTRPRPPKRGAYYYAARFGVPVVSCFISMAPTAKAMSADFTAVQFHMHVLPTIWPDHAKSVRDNAQQMMQQDYAQKCAAYQAAYGQAVTAPFSPQDIAGWRHATIKEA